MKEIIFVSCLVINFSDVLCQNSKMSLPLSNIDAVIPKYVAVQPAVYQGRKSIKVLDTASGISTEGKYAKLPDIYFSNGSIEIEVAGKPSATALEGARGFVGIAFRIDDKDTQFECIYLRPTNGRSNDQIRRNHSIQYISYPDYPWQRLRQETPEKYESYVDLEVGKWTKIKIEIEDSVARLYVHGASQPNLIVSDLKHAKNAKGNIGLWIGPGTEAYFRNLVVTIKD